MKKPLVGLAILAALIPAIAGAMEIKSNPGNGGSITTAKGNVYEVGGTVTISTTTPGDLYSAGGTLVLGGGISKDLVAAGGTVSVNGQVGEDLRVVGGTVIVGGNVGGDLLLAGGQLQVNKGVAIQGDTLIAGGDIKMEGSAQGSVKIFGGTVYINGPIAKDLEVRANRLEFGSDAVASGSIKYYGPQEAVIDQGARISNISFSKTEQNNRGRASAAGASWLTGFLAATALALAIYLIRRRDDYVPMTWASFGKEVVRGLVLLIVIPVAVIICFITFIGWMLGLAGLVLYILFILLALGYSGIVSARLLNQWLFKRKFEWWMVILGVLALSILLFIPVLGWIAYMLIFMASFGMLMNGLYLNARKV